MNQKDEEGNKSEQPPQHPPHHGHGHHGHGGHGWGHHGRWGPSHHDNSSQSSQSSQGCPPWVAHKMAWMKKMQEECQGACPPWMAKKMEWLKSMMSGQQNESNSQGPPAWARNKSQPGQSQPKMKAAYVADVNIPDRSEVASGLTLIKTWKLRNTGNSAWEGCYLAFVKGDKSLIAGIEDTSLNGRFPVAKAAPNSIVEVCATIQTPKKSGRYCAYFRLHSVDGKRFGPQIWVDIMVSDEASADQDVDMSLRPCQIKRVQKNAKRVAKLDKQQRKLQKKLTMLERREKEFRERAEDSETMGKAKKVAKFERKAQAAKNKMQKIGSRLEEVTVERDERASVVEQLYAAPTNQQEISTGIQSMTIDDDENKEQTNEPTDVKQPTESPMVAFQYQNEFEQIMAFGFDVEPNVVRYLLTENKGNVGAVVNNLLAAS